MSTSPEMLLKEQVDCESSTAKKINKLLNSSKTRIEGLQLLSLFLPRCSDEDFLQFCISWMQSCCKIDSLTKNKDYATCLLSNLFKISSNYQELKKSVSFFITTRYFDYFFKHLLNSQAGWCCTESCLLYYRGACGPFQVTLEKHLKNEIEKNKRISSTVGGCYALLPCIGGGGNDGVNYMKNWKTQFLNFLNICHSILNELFANVEEFQEFETQVGTKGDNKEKMSPEDLTVQLTNHSIVLKYMLLNQFPAPKSVPSDLIFQLICRGLSLNLKVLARQKTAGDVSFEKILPEIQYELLSLLRALIVTCKNQLLPYSHLICKLIKQILEWTESDITFGNNSLFERLRILAYEVLCDWLAVARSGSCVEVISNVVLSNGLNDLRPKKKVVFLKESKLQKRQKGKEQTSSQMYAPANGRLCHTALKTLQFLLKFVGVLLKSEEQKFLQESVVKLIMEMQKNSSPDVPVPYNLPACRAELYSLLLELVCQPCSKWPPPTNYALRFFREGINDPCPEVSSLCSAAINYTTIIIHPQYDNGGFPQSDVPVDGRRTELEPQWTDSEEIMEVVNGEDGEVSQEMNSKIEEKSLETDKIGKPETPDVLSEESVIPSDEDSRSTGKFTQDSVELRQRELSVDETETNIFSTETHQMNGEPHAKKQRTLAEDGSTLDKTPSPVKEKLNESGSVNKTPESDKRKNALEKTVSPIKEKLSESQTPESNKIKKTMEKTPSPILKEKLNESDSGKETPENIKRKSARESSHWEERTSSKSVSPESVNEENHMKTRYFLRSKTKESSEEPEEQARITNSSEALKSAAHKSSVTRNTPNIQSEKKRPRTRALSRGKTNNETESKSVEKNGSKDDDVDEEDIKAAFNDSFVD